MVSGGTTGTAATKFDIDRSHSAVEFTVRFMGLSKVRGSFKQFDGTIMYVDDDPTRSTVTLVVRAASIDTDVEFRDQ